MNREVKEQILQKIKAYDRIFLFRHVRPDGDCMGATKGFADILRKSFPEKEVYVIGGETAKYLEFMGPEDAPVADELYTDALGIVLDTGSEARISNPNYKLCKEVIKIDHHIPLEQYGNLQWVEEERSSCCEMIVDFYNTFKDELVLDSEGATHLYTGMVTDSGRFQFRGVGGDTMRLAGLLLDQDIDTDWIYSNLYLRGFHELKFKARVYDEMCVTENGVAYIYVSREMKKTFGLTNESASAVVSYLENIKGCLCWLAFIENDEPDNTIRVRLRSRYVAINTIAERYRGGGHACASGATVYDQAEVEALLRDADALVKEYKETNEGWL